jgi:hypothetical protein
MDMQYCKITRERVFHQFQIVSCTEIHLPPLYQPVCPSTVNSFSFVFSSLSSILQIERVQNNARSQILYYQQNKNKNKYSLIWLSGECRPGECNKEK